MKKYLLIILVHVYSGLVIAQKPENVRRDSLKLDSMKTALQQLKGISRINCLNNIATACLDQAGQSGQHRSDSAFRYGNLANDEAKAAGNKYEQARALISLARSKQFIQKVKESGKYVRPALQLSIEINDNDLTGKCYNMLAGIENRGEYYKKAIDCFQKTNNLLSETESTTWLCMDYSDKGQYEDAFHYCERCVLLASENVGKDSTEWAHELVMWSYYDMSGLYQAAGDYETALEYTFKGNAYAAEKKINWELNAEISELYCLMNKPDSALFYWNIWKQDYNHYMKGHQAYGNNIYARIYLTKQQPDSALAILDSSLAIYESMALEAGFIPPIKTLLLRAEAFNQKKQYAKALSNAKVAVKRAERNNIRPLMMDSYQTLSLTYHNLKMDRNAYENLVKYNTIRDSIQNKQFLIRLNNYKRELQDAKKEARISLLDRDNSIKQQQLKQEATFRYFIIAAFFALLFAGLYVFRNINLKRKNERLWQEQKEQEWKMKELESENKHTELQKKSAELEMQALRAQMNPHFIFNSLSSINHFILKNEGKTASNYLTRFSRLIRMVLINSQKQLITLNDELEMLRIYLDMERLRFKNSFSYVIGFTNDIDTETVLIPPLILQPFCENAIWHGLTHKDDQGQLNIDLSQDGNFLKCIVSDNGIGRNRAAELTSKSPEKGKSFGLQITTERLALLNQSKNVEPLYTIEDILDEGKNIAGTRVVLRIRRSRLKEEFV